MRGSAGIFIIIGILLIAFVGFLFYSGFLNFQKAPEVQNQPTTYEKLSDDPAYQEVRDKYDLNEEQLRILSTVNPEDNE